MTPDPNRNALDPNWVCARARARTPLGERGAGARAGVRR
jgi:hypothetical protein